MGLVACPFCGAQLQSDSDLAGRTVACAECAGRFLILPAIAPVRTATSSSAPEAAAPRRVAGHRGRDMLVAMLAGFGLGAFGGAVVGTAIGEFTPFLGGSAVELPEPFGSVRLETIPLHAAVIGLWSAAVGALLAAAVTLMRSRAQVPISGLHMRSSAPTPSQPSARAARTTPRPTPQPAIARPWSDSRRRTVALLTCAVVLICAVGLAAVGIATSPADHASQPISQPDRVLTCEALAATFSGDATGKERTLWVTVHVRNNGPVPAGLEPRIDFAELADSAIAAAQPAKIVKLVDERGTTYAGRAAGVQSLRTTKTGNRKNGHRAVRRSHPTSVLAGRAVRKVRAATLRDKSAERFGSSIIARSAGAKRSNTETRARR